MRIVFYPFACNIHILLLNLYEKEKHQFTYVKRLPSLTNLDSLGIKLQYSLHFTFKNLKNNFQVQYSRVTMPKSKKRKKEVDDGLKPKPLTEFTESKKMVIKLVPKKEEQQA
jgi:hypothetical protein